MSHRFFYCYFQELLLDFGCNEDVYAEKDNGYTYHTFSCFTAVKAFLFCLAPYFFQTAEGKKKNLSSH